MGLFYTAPEPTRGDIPMDIGFYFNVEQGETFCLVKPKQGHKFAGGGCLRPHAEDQHGGNLRHLLLFGKGRGDLKN